MLSLYELKPKFQNLLRPVVNQLAHGGVTANQVTIVATVLSVITAILMIVWHQYPSILLIVPPLLLIRMALNAIDGMLAREHHMKTTLGGILNELTDVIADAFIYLPFALIAGVSSYLIVIIVVTSIISEMAGVLGITAGGTRRYDGPMGKSDRAFLFAIISLGVGLGIQPGVWLDFVLAITIILLVINIINRVQNTLKEGQTHDI